MFWLIVLLIILLISDGAKSNAINRYKKAIDHHNKMVEREAREARMAKQAAEQAEFDAWVAKNTNIVEAKVDNRTFGQKLVKYVTIMIGVPLAIIVVCRSCIGF